MVEGTSDPWTPNDLATARLIGESVTDVIQQFRSVRLLIAQNQTEQIGNQVRLSEQPVLVADAAGMILLTNHAFDRLLGTTRRPRYLPDILPIFVDQEEAGQQFMELQAYRRPWRGETALDIPNGGGTRQFLVRADPVLSAPNQTLGFVFILNDLSERKAAEDARRRFQEGIVERHRMLTIPLNSKTDLRFRDLLASIVGNAQLAAMEITDNLDVARVPEMLASVESSVARTTELLEHLVWYANRDSKRDN